MVSCAKSEREGPYCIFRISIDFFHFYLLRFLRASLGQDWKRLRKKRLLHALRAGLRQQGSVFPQRLTARLKSCPDTRLHTREIFAGYRHTAGDSSTPASQNRARRGPRGCATRVSCLPTSSSPVSFSETSKVVP
jgi:hypothetical protein